MYGYLRDAIVCRTSRAMEDLIRSAEAVPPDRLDWSPLGEGRTVLDLVRECVEVNDRWTHILLEKCWMERSSEEMSAYCATMPDLLTAMAKLRRATAAYIEAIRNVPYEELSFQLTLPWNTISMADALMHAADHMSYHKGQICYIQTLYGDWEER